MLMLKFPICSKFQGCDHVTIFTIAINPRVTTTAPAKDDEDDGSDGVNASWDGKHDPPSVKHYMVKLFIPVGTATFRQMSLWWCLFVSWIASKGLRLQKSKFCFTCLWDLHNCLGCRLRPPKSTLVHWTWIILEEVNNIFQNGKSLYLDRGDDDAGNTPKSVGQSHHCPWPGPRVLPTYLCKHSYHMCYPHTCAKHWLYSSFNQNI